MGLRKCEWRRACVWDEKDKIWKRQVNKYRIGHKKAIFRIKTLLTATERYSCEGCIRQILEEKVDILEIEKITPLTKKAKRVLVKTIKMKFREKLRDCDWGRACVWFEDVKMEDLPNYTDSKKYRIGHKKAIFFLREGNITIERYACEGCVREIIGEGISKRLDIKEIIPLTERAKKILILLKL